MHRTPEPLVTRAEMGTAGLGPSWAVAPLSLVFIYLKLCIGSLGRFPYICFFSGYSDLNLKCYNPRKFQQIFKIVAIYTNYIVIFSLSNSQPLTY